MDDYLWSPYLQRTADPDVIRSLIDAQTQQDALRLQALRAQADHEQRERLAQFEAQARESLQAQNIAGQTRLQHMGAQEQMALERLRQAGIGSLTRRGL
jgi:membrane protein involved in colicin uptake